MRGTVFADWLAKEYQPELLAIKEQFQAQWDKVKGYNTFKEKPLYGGCLNTNEKGRDYITLDGGCGYESIVRIANAIGLNVSRIDAGRNLDVLLVSMKQVETCAI